MKKIIFFITVLIFTSWGCDKDSVLDPIDPGHGVIQVPATAKTGDTAQTPGKTPTVPQASDTSIYVKGVVMFEFKDIDNNVYHAIQIGNQIWSKENLKTTHNNEGRPIPCVQSSSKWGTLYSGAYCHYNNDPSNSYRNGLLYNYFAAASGKLAPNGWHVATYEDWNRLMVEIGNKPLPWIGNVGPLVDQADWKGPFYSILDHLVMCTNSTCFTALPNGYRDNFGKEDPVFEGLDGQASWWAINNLDSGVMIYFDQTFGIFTREDRKSYVGSGIRLVKDID